MKKTLKIIVMLAIVAAVVYAGFYIFRSYQNEEVTTVFRTEKVVRTDIIRSISATGTVEPEELINVGAQINGKIMSFGIDADGNPMDYGSRVTAGMVLATIDDVTYKADLQEAQASCEQAEASIFSAEASIASAKANAALAEKNWKRAEILKNQNSITESDYDSAYASYLTSQAELTRAQAELARAKASQSIANAVLDRAVRNLEYCVITSPVDGIIIDRRVSVGQTVVSNQSASSIFLVAKEFNKMQVWVSVNEADIGSITPGMEVQFSCDAFPGEQFYGVVSNVRLNATLSSNVVTYIVEVDADNSNGKLIPYLTANVKFIRSARRGVKAVPTAALRFQPPFELQVMPPPALDNANEAILWIPTAENLLKPMKVKTGLSNGMFVEIDSQEAAVDTAVVTAIDYQLASATASDNDSMNNPFLPNMPKRSGRGSAGQRERAEQRQAEAAKAGQTPPATPPPGAGK